MRSNAPYRCFVSDLFTHAGDAGQAPAIAQHFVRVAVERGLDHDPLDAGLTYATSEPMSVGRHVEVPLGRGNRPVPGIVIDAGGPELAGDIPLSRIKPIVRDTGTGLTPALVELGRWMSEYYVCPLGMVLAVMLPAAVKDRTGLKTRTLVNRAPESAWAGALEAVGGKLSPTVASAWEKLSAVSADAWPMSPQAAAGAAESRTLGPINRLIKLGLLVEVERDEIVRTGGVDTTASVEQDDPKLPGLHTQRPTLTPEQQHVVDGILKRSDAFGVHLVHGVTGSGKTEVYLRILERVLDTPERAALVLVPEISLTPQTAGRFVQRFASMGVAVLHSGLSKSQRHREWDRVAKGEARVVVGARSAVFAPVSKIGLVVVDEEHASDYKQDNLPRYHGRDVAIKLAQMSGCPVVLGSATPSLESWANAHAGADGSPAKYTLWTMTQRAGGGRMPRVEIVDMTQERRLRASSERLSTDAYSRGSQRLLGPTLERAIADTLHACGQVILLLNRRGYSTYIACPDSVCGFVLSCEDCDARLVQHRVIAGKHPPKGVVRCHHCLAQNLLPEVCPTCGRRLMALGIGTQRAEEELARSFGRMLGLSDEDAARWHDAPVGALDRDPQAGWPRPPGLVRVDGDTMSSAADYFAVLSRFAKGEVQMLLGTQMIAKGLDFPNVRLVGVIDADTSLSLPDFRSSERTFQLVSQVAGRAGRGSTPGRVIVQTFDPHSPAIVHAATHDFPAFAREELETRVGAGLPPATRMARIVVRDEDLAKAQAQGEQIAKALGEEIARLSPNQRPLIAGPMPCPIARIAGQHRLAIELTASGRMVIQRVLQGVRARGLLVSDASTAIDVDPIALT